MTTQDDRRGHADDHRRGDGDDHRHRYEEGDESAPEEGDEEDEFFTDLSLAVRAQRREHRIDQRTLAARAGVSKSTVARIERGDSGVALTALRRVLAEVGLGVILVDQDGYPWQDGRALPADLDGAVDAADRRLPAHLPAMLTDALRSWDFSRARGSGFRAPARWRYDRWSDDVEALVQGMREEASSSRGRRRLR